MIRVSVDDLNIAIAWLENNEGDEEESGACQRVAAFLKLQVTRRIENGVIRKVSKEHKVEPSRVRAAINRGKQLKGTSHV
jgi:hypothetical protein